MTELLRVARREFAGFFASPAAYLFLGAFLGVTLFVFFWVETFFARIGAPDKRKVFYPRSHHLILHDKDRGKVLRELDGWIREHLPAGPSSGK